jgi:hypothetical protein
VVSSGELKTAKHEEAMVIEKDSFQQSMRSFQQQQEKALRCVVATKPNGPFAVGIQRASIVHGLLMHMTLPLAVPCLIDHVVFVWSNTHTKWNGKRL